MPPLLPPLPDEPEVPLLPLVPELPDVPPAVPLEVLGALGVTAVPLLGAAALELLELLLGLELVLEEAFTADPHSLNPYAEAAVWASDLALSSSVSNWVGSSPRWTARPIFWPADTSSAIALRKASRLVSVGGLSWLIESITP